MATVYDVSGNELVEKAAEELKKVSQIKPVSWASFVKTGVHKERPPMKDDWWYARAASILKYIYKLGPIGVSKLRNKYGGRKNRGHAPEHTFTGSGNIVRKIIQQLDAAGLTKQVDKGQHKGRIITPKGKSLLDKVATQIMKDAPRMAKVKKSVIAEAEAKPKHKKEAKEAKPVQEKQEAKAETKAETKLEVKKKKQLSSSN